MPDLPSSHLPARFDGLDLSQTELVAQMYLVTFGQPTRRGYEASLKIWFKWCQFHELEPLKAQRAHIELWMRELEEHGNRFATRRVKPLMSSTVSGMLNPVVGFYKFAHRERYVADDITTYLKRPKVSNESRREGMTRFELRAVLDTAKESSPLDYALLCVLACNGLRIGEVCSLDTEDIHQQGGYLAINVQRLKGNRSGDIPIIPMLSTALEHYLGTRKTGPLFYKTRKEERMDQKAALRIVKRITRAAGVEKNITNHSFRHTHITLLLNEGMAIRDIVNSMGYADARQVSRYDRDKQSLARSGAWVVGAALEGF